MKKSNLKSILLALIPIIIIFIIIMICAGNFLGWFNFGESENNINNESNLLVEILTNIFSIIAFILIHLFLLFLALLPVIICLYIYRKMKYNYYKHRQDKETELQLLKEQNELLKSIVENNKGE